MRVTSPERKYEPRKILELRNSWRRLDEDEESTEKRLFFNFFVYLHDQLSAIADARKDDSLVLSPDA